MRPPVGALVGTPNAGKSTLLNHLLRLSSASQLGTADYPFSTHTIERCTLALPLPSEAKESTGQWHCELWDTPSLTAGSAQGRGLGNQFLPALSAVDFLIFVVTTQEDSRVLEQELLAFENSHPFTPEYQLRHKPRLYFTLDEILALEEASSSSLIDLLWQKMRQAFKSLSLFTLQIEQQKIHIVTLQNITVGELLATIHPDLLHNCPAVTDQHSGKMAPFDFAIQNGDALAITPR